MARIATSSWMANITPGRVLDSIISDTFSLSYSAYHANNTAVLKELYTLFGIDTTKDNSIIKDEKGHLINAGAVLREKIMRKEDIIQAENCSQSVETFLKTQLKNIVSDGTCAQ